MIVDNKPGASNNLGTDALAKSPPDGCAIGIVGASHSINKFLFKNPTRALPPASIPGGTPQEHAALIKSDLVK